MWQYGSHIHLETNLGSAREGSAIFLDGVECDDSDGGESGPTSTPTIFYSSAFQLPRPLLRLLERPVKNQLPLELQRILRATMARAALFAAELRNNFDCSLYKGRKIGVGLLLKKCWPKKLDICSILQSWTKYEQYSMSIHYIFRVPVQVKYFTYSNLNFILRSHFTKEWNINVWGRLHKNCLGKK